MAYNAKILADHLAPSGKRIVTYEVTFPRIVLSEFNTHRVLSRNSSSSRAIPVEKMLRRVETDPFVPTYWGKNQRGMQAEEAFSEYESEGLRLQWLRARDQAVFAATSLMESGVHKQLVNRLLEPFMWQTVLVTATEFDNFFGLRCHRDAQPEIREIALMMERLYDQHEPIDVEEGFWHLPLVEDRYDLEAEGFTEDEIRQVSVGRCARVSYLTHDGKRDPRADIELCRRLRASGHMSPFEHVAQALGEPTPSGNFFGWTQYRKSIPNEAIYLPDHA